MKPMASRCPKVIAAARTAERRRVPASIFARFEQLRNFRDVFIAQLILRPPTRASCTAMPERRQVHGLP
jgi:hypothetical protein